MAFSRTYGLFIGHGWIDYKEYHLLVNMLDRVPDFEWINYSVIEHDPVINSATEEGRELLKDKVRKQIEPANCVIVISDIYNLFREWIETEIEMAVEMNNKSEFDKLIMCVTSDDFRNIPKKVQLVADVLVGWDAESIVKAIKLYSV